MVGCAKKECVWLLSGWGKSLVTWSISEVLLPLCASVVVIQLQQCGRNWVCLAKAVKLFDSKFIGKT